MWFGRSMRDLVDRVGLASLIDRSALFCLAFPLVPCLYSTLKRRTWCVAEPLHFSTDKARISLITMELKLPVLNPLLTTPTHIIHTGRPRRQPTDWTARRDRCLSLSLPHIPPSSLMAGQTSAAAAAAEQQLLGLHERLWGLATELLVPEQGEAAHRRAPRAIIEVCGWGDEL